MPDVNLYTLAQLTQDATQVIEHLNERNEPAFVTQHGRFVALILPLAGVPIESIALKHGALAEEVERRAREGGPTFTVEELLAAVADPDRFDCPHCGEPLRIPYTGDREDAMRPHLPNCHHPLADDE